MSDVSRRRRSIHFVPGGNVRMMEKALTLPADVLILDLEDAVAPDRKAATRPIVRQWLSDLDFGGRERWVRMNPIYGELGALDIEETIAARPHGYVVPKPRRASDVRDIAQLLDREEERHGVPHGSTKILLIATETPEGLLNIREISVASPRIVGISWGIEDLGAAMGLPKVRDAENRYLDIPRYARVMCAVAASAAGVEALDTVYTDIPDLDGLRRECREGVAMGFSGKISIHPDQIEVINREFTPSKAEAEDALALIAAFEEHTRKGAGAFAWKGQMMDQPHLTRAKKIADRARQAGVI